MSEAMEDRVVLVDESDNAIGSEGKLAAHRKGLLHRAFSIFLFNSHGEMLLQRRALEKYHSGGLWTNTCCSHPGPNEALPAATKRRLREEMGISCALEKKFSFIYRAEFENGLIEHELDHVFIGQYEGAIQPNPEEVMDYQWQPMAKIAELVATVPEQFTVWFRIALEQAQHRNAFIQPA